MKKLIIFVAITAAVCATSCSTTPLSVTSSITPLEGKTITENLGETEGSDTAFSVLGLFMIGGPDINEAINEAVTSKGGDTLINVRCYENWNYWLLFSTTQFVIYGDAVKISDTADSAKGGKK